MIFSGDIDPCSKTEKRKDNPALGQIINIFIRSVLFEKVQDTGDCDLTGRSVSSQKTSRPVAVVVSNIQEEKQ